MNNGKRIAFLRKQLDECNSRIACLEIEKIKLLQENKSLVDSLNTLHDEVCSLKDKLETLKNKYKASIHELNVEKNRYIKAINSITLMKKNYQERMNKLLAELTKHN